MSLPSYTCPLDNELAALLFSDYPYEQQGECSRDLLCYTFDTGYVYGLLDARINDIFYVGSTIQTPGKRYSAHMGGRDLSNFREAWILSILADGSLPIFLSLGEFQTPCELEVRAMEKAIASALRAMGHTALSDDDRSDILAHRFPLVVPADRRSKHNWRLWENAIAEYQAPARSSSGFLTPLVTGFV